MSFIVPFLKNSNLIIGNDVKLSIKSFNSSEEKSEVSIYSLRLISFKFLSDKSMTCSPSSKFLFPSFDSRDSNKSKLASKLVFV